MPLSNRTKKVRLSRKILNSMLFDSEQIVLNVSIYEAVSSNKKNNRKADKDTAITKKESDAVLFSYIQKNAIASVHSYTINLEVNKLEAERRSDINFINYHADEVDLENILPHAKQFIPSFFQTNYYETKQTPTFFVLETKAQSESLSDIVLSSLETELCKMGYVGFIYASSGGASAKFNYSSEYRQVLWHYFKLYDDHVENLLAKGKKINFSNKEVSAAMPFYSAKIDLSTTQSPLKRSPALSKNSSPFEYRNGTQIVTLMVGDYISGDAYQTYCYGEPKESLIGTCCNVYTFPETDIKIRLQCISANERYHSFIHRYARYADICYVILEVEGLDDEEANSLLSKACYFKNEIRLFNYHCQIYFIAAVSSYSQRNRGSYPELNNKLIDGLKENGFSGFLQYPYYHRRTDALEHVIITPVQMFLEMYSRKKMLS